MESEAVTYGARIKYDTNGKLMISKKIYSNGHKMARVIIDTEELVFKLIDPVTGVAHYESSKKWSNLEVLQRHVKMELKDKLGIRFDKEKRKQTNG